MFLKKGLFCINCKWCKLNFPMSVNEAPLGSNAVSIAHPTRKNLRRETSMLCACPKSGVQASIRAGLDIFSDSVGAGTVQLKDELSKETGFGAPCFAHRHINLLVCGCQVVVQTTRSFLSL